MIIARTSLEVTKQNIPLDLRQSSQWVLWRYEESQRGTSKIPYTVYRGRRASSTNPTNWTTLEHAIQAFESGRDYYSGIGFVFTESDPFVGIDLDDCIDEAGEAVPEAREIVERLASYAEISPSGSGIKLWVRGELPEGCRKKSNKVAGFGQIEAYDSGRYFCVTGRLFSASPITIEKRQEEIDWLVEKYLRRGTHPPRALSRDNGNGFSGINVERARRYLAKMPGGISGRGGHDATFAAACEVFRFGLSDDEAQRLLLEFNSKCEPAWSATDLQHKLADAKRTVQEAEEFGCRLLQRPLGLPLAAPNGGGGEPQDHTEVERINLQGKTYEVGNVKLSAKLAGVGKTRIVVTIDGSEVARDVLNLESARSRSGFHKAIREATEIDDGELASVLMKMAADMDAERQRQANVHAREIAAAERASDLADRFVVSFGFKWHRERRTAFSERHHAELFLGDLWRHATDADLDSVEATVEGLQCEKNGRPPDFRARLTIFKAAVAMATARLVGTIPDVVEIEDEQTKDAGKLRDQVVGFLIAKRHFRTATGTAIELNYYEWSRGLSPGPGWQRCYSDFVFAKLEEAGEVPQIAVAGEVLSRELKASTTKKLAANLRRHQVAKTGERVTSDGKQWRVWLLSDPIVSSIGETED